MIRNLLKGMASIGEGMASIMEGMTSFTLFPPPSDPPSRKYAEKKLSEYRRELERLKREAREKSRRYKNPRR